MMGLKARGLGILVLTVAVALSAGLLVTWPASAQDETVSIDSLSLTVGEQGSVDLELLNMGPARLRAWAMDVAFDSSVVSAVDCSPNPEGLCNAFFSPTSARFVGAADPRLEGDVLLGTISFRCDDVGTSPLSIIVDVLVDGTFDDPQEIAATIQDGSITCSPGDETVTIESLSLIVGELGSVDLELLNMGPPGLGAWTIHVAFDSSVVSAVDCSSSPGGSVCDAFFSPTSARFAGGIDPGLEGDVLLGAISFRCEDVGTSPLSISVDVLVDGTPGDPQDIAAAIQDGTITCSDATVSIDSLSLTVGEQGSVDLELLNMGPPGLFAWTIDVAFDSSVVSAVDCSPGPPDNSVCNAFFSPTSARFTGAIDPTQEGDVLLGTISFRCDDAGTSPLSISVNVLADATPGDPQDIAATIQDGSITCSPGAPTPISTPAAPKNLEVIVVQDGQLIQLSWQDNASNEDAYIIQRSIVGAGGPWNAYITLPPNTTTFDDGALVPGFTYWYRIAAENSAGRSAYSNVAFGTASELPTPPIGDADCNGFVTSIDALVILQVLAGLLDFLSCEAFADVNVDGELTSVDALLILQFIAGLIDSLPP